jgi:hypothetical protein
MTSHFETSLFEKGFSKKATFIIQLFVEKSSLKKSFL